MASEKNKSVLDQVLEQQGSIEIGNQSNGAGVTSSATTSLNNACPSINKSEVDSDQAFSSVINNILNRQDVRAKITAISSSLKLQGKSDLEIEEAVNKVVFAYISTSAVANTFAERRNNRGSANGRNGASNASSNQIHVKDDNLYASAKGRCIAQIPLMLQKTNLLFGNPTNFELIKTDKELSNAHSLNVNATYIVPSISGAVRATDVSPVLLTSAQLEVVGTFGDEQIFINVGGNIVTNLKGLKEEAEAKGLKVTSVYTQILVTGSVTLDGPILVGNDMKALQDGSDVLNNMGLFILLTINGKKQLHNILDDDSLLYKDSEGNALEIPYISNERKSELATYRVMKNTDINFVISNANNTFNTVSASNITKYTQKAPNKTV